MITPEEIAELFVGHPESRRNLARLIRERDIQIIQGERTHAEGRMSEFRDKIRKVLDEKKLSWWTSSIVPPLIDEILNEIGIPEPD